MKTKHQYERIPFENTSLPIRVNHAMNQTNLDGVDIEVLSWHEQIEILRFHAGEATVCCGNKAFHVSDGDLVIINPCEVHSVIMVGETTTYDCIMIDSSMYELSEVYQDANRYFTLLADNHVCFETVISDDPTLLDIVDSICAETLHREPMYELAVHSLSYSLMIHLFRSHVYSGSAFRQLVENVERYDRIKPALLIMKSQLGERLPLDKLANACHLSSSHFCRLFRQITGKSPVQYLLDIRLQEATTLLKRTNKSITEIAYEVGFDNVGYFSRKFKEAFGIPPTQAKTGYVDYRPKKK